MANEIRDAFRSAFRDYETDGVPSSGIHQVQKKEARSLGEIVQSYVQAASEGAIVAANWAQLSATTGTRAGQPGRVPSSDNGTHTDPVVGGTVRNSGEYSWSSSPAGWRRVGDVVDQSPIISGYQVPIIFDRQGVLGAARTAYLGRTFYWRRSSKVLNVSNFGADSARLPGLGYTEIQWPDNTTLYLIYIDSGDTAAGYKVVKFDLLTTLNAENVFPIATVWYGKVHFCEYDWRYAEDVQGQFFCRTPIILDDGKARMPRFAWSNSEVTINTAVGATDFYPYADVDFPSVSTQAQILSYDHGAKLRGGDGFVVRDYPADPQNPFVYPLITTFYGGIGNSGQVPVVGDGVPGTIIPNLMATGKNAPEKASRTVGTIGYVDIADPTLNALGFTRGWKASTSGNAYIGTRMLDVQPGKWAFIRVFALADNDTDLGVLNNLMRVSWIKSGSGSSSESLLLAKKHSARVYEFVFWGKMPFSSTPDTPYDGIVVGANVNSGRSPVFTVPQIGYGASGMAWIKGTDWPTLETSKDEKIRRLYASSTPMLTDADLLHSAHVWGINGRPVPFYPANMVQASNEGNEHTISLNGVSANGGGVPFAEVVSPYGQQILADRLPDSMQLVSRYKAGSVKGVRQRILANVHKVDASALSGKTFSYLVIGDSLIEYSGTVVALKRKLAALGATATALGTITSTETGYSGASTGDTSVSEGRRSRAYADYINQITTNLAPVTNWSSYMALTSDNRRAFNPFIRPSTGGDPAPYIYNGYIFDLRFYLDRAGYADPQFVFVNLGANDYGQNTNKATAAAQVLAGMTVMYNQIRAALPNAVIVFVTNSMAWNDNAVTRWNADYGPLIKQMLEFVAANAADTKLFVLDNHARICREFGFQYTAGSTDAKGVQTVTEDNDLHYAGVGNEQWAEGALALIANRI